MRQILFCIVFLLLAGFVVLLPASDYRVNVVGGLAVLGGLVLMTVRAVQGSQRRRLERTAQIADRATRS